MNTEQREKHPWIYDVLVIAVLAAAAFLRLSGANWGELQHQHPDELFLTGVLANLRAHECMDDSVPIDACPTEQQRWIGLDDYFNTKTSTLNPHNRGFAFFVYGTLPMFIIRYTAELTGQTDYDQLKLLGRQFSALADLGTILLLYVIASRLYNRRTALLAAAFSAFAVMQIQQSHFFTTDLFVNLFSFLAIYFAVLIVESGEQRVESGEQRVENSKERVVNGDSSLPTRHSPPSTPYSPPSTPYSPPSTPYSPPPTPYSPPPTPYSPLSTLYSLLSTPLSLLSLAFGFSFGLALASKVNIYPLALLLPAAFLLRYFTTERKEQTADEKPPSEPKEQSSAARFLPAVTTDYWSLRSFEKEVIVCLILGGLAAFLAFRVFQPYAFNGLLPNQQWLDNIAEQRVQARGDADLPWNLQWARRTHLYSFTNLTVWGLGLPLGILAWAGFLVMGWRILKGERQHLLLWGWTAFYFTWQSLQFNPTMRYQLPVYPLLAMMAAWVVFELADAPSSRTAHRRLRIAHYVLPVIGLLVLITTAAWAFAFQSIYTREETRLAASRWIYQNVPAPINLRIQLADGSVYNQPVPFPSGSLILPGSPYETTFSAARDGLLTEVSLGYLADTLASGPHTLSLLAANAPNPTPEQTLARSALTGDFAPSDDPRGAPATLVLTPPLQVRKGEILFLHLETSGGALTLSGANIANETDYDYSLPFRTEYDGFGNIYRGDLNFQVYWDDNADKLARFTETLDQTDYILIPTNHQYAQITRLPERYPLTTVYYRELLGCPPERNIIACYRQAEPGMFEGRLGFELVKTFTSYPTLGPLVINDQAAEEAFTFYDHPKVMIFQKRADYDPAAVRAILGSVDLTNVVHLTPREASTYKDLMLSDERLAVQRAGGTWSELFDYDHLQNKYPLIGLFIWYVFVFALGALTYPVIRLALPGLGQSAWPLARTLGLIILAYVPWLLGSLGISYSRATIGLVFAAIAAAGTGVGWMRRDDLAAEWKSNHRYFLTVEVIFLSFFLFDLLIRLGNPDLWHPAKGGERPMDFSYLNAVLKSTTFPPYDPWFAGGYINYYYYGFVLVGTPVKLLGIVPSIAYNFLLPTWFALTAVNAFAVGSALVERGVESRGVENRGVESSKVEGAACSPLSTPYSLIAGLASALLMTALGNLGTIQMVFQALARIAAPGGSIADSHFFQRLLWASEGLYKSIAQGAALPIGRGEWYWNPSRVIPPGPGNEITEFPFFTFLYSDLHAHMIVMPLALFVMAWALGTILARRTSLLSLAVGALVIGALYPANLSDMYTYLPVGLTALAYALWRTDKGALPRWPVVATSVAARRLIWIVLNIAILTALSFGLYSPYRTAYSQAYSKLDPWTATQTPLTSYLTHWGLFLFVIFAWLVWETREWMAATPVSALNKLKPFQLLIELALALFIVALLYLAYRKIWIGWIALPMAAWAGLLLLRPQLADTKRLALFWVGTALVITLVVELVTVRGDIGRMNTIFKFYLQAWALLSVSAGAAFVWVLIDVHKWRQRWRSAWQGGIIVLVSGALLFTVTATTDKVNDRINQDAPHSFDSMEYMAHSEYWDSQSMDLSQDYRAIRWMQDHVKGSPVIVETNCPEYRWCSRFTIYTGLPGVVGWNWHQRQQRALIPPNLITDRVDAIGAFYNSTDPEFARAFLAQYDVRYIIVGQLEAIYYPDGGLAKFEQFDGKLWKSVYHDAQTTIYEVLP